MKNVTFLLLLSFVILENGCTKSSTTNNNNPTVTICNQVWATKNLDVTNYRNGDPIPEISDSATWVNDTTGAWCYYNNDSSNAAIYGKLYNWYAVNDPRGLAPTGWHIPSDSEWTTISTCLGGDGVSGGAMKETGKTHWLSPNTGASNSSGFTALPGSGRNVNGAFSVIGIFGDWWSTTEATVYNSNLVWVRTLYNNSANINKSVAPKGGGISVRCVKD